MKLSHLRALEAGVTSPRRGEVKSGATGRTDAVARAPRRARAMI
jgi:hypothetical protein